MQRGFSAWPDGWRRQTGLHAWRSAPTLSRRMPDGAVVFGRERGCTDFEKMFGRVISWEIRCQGVLRSDGSDEEQQQAEEHGQKKENDEHRHQNRPSALRLRLAVFAAGFKLLPHFAQV